MSCYQLENLTFTYPNNSLPALADVSFSVEAGQFVVVCGLSGCGKTTLLRQLKPALAPHGLKSGEIRFDGCLLSELDDREQSQKIGFVMQSPDNQIVTDKVWHELAFGLEGLGMDTPTIRRRVAEMASFFGIQTWFYKKVEELSGGQKQLLNLASIMAMQPSALILDEPTSQLDPIAASEFLDIVGKINRELGVTVIITEHRLEDVFPHSDRVIVMDGGKIIANGTAREIGAELKKRAHGMFSAMPVPMRVYASVDGDGDCPVTVREGKSWINQFTIHNSQFTIEERTERGKAALEVDEAWFKYEKDLPDVLKGLSFKAYSGEIFAVLGGNGTGKTTALSLVGGLFKPYRGKIKLFGEDINKIPPNKMFDEFLGVLAQNPQTVFVKKTVFEDLMEIFDGKKISQEEKYRQIKEMAELCNISGLMKSHPYDLSGGEQQRAALAKILLLKPRILLLDEPTKGLDAEFKQAFAEILHSLTERGVCVVIVSHDIEFCALYADRCALFFDGAIVSEGKPREFFSGNSFYTTAANRMARHILPEAVTAEDIIYALGGKPVNFHNKKESVAFDFSEPEKKPPLSFWRIFTAIISGISLVTALIFALMSGNELMSFISGGDAAADFLDNTAKMWKYSGIVAVILLSAVAISTALSRAPREEPIKTKKKEKVSKRTVIAAFMILLTIPLTIWFGEYFLGDRKYYFISMLIILEASLPFVLVFESRKPQARELIIIAVLCAIAVAGRAAFFMLPQFKPVAAVVIIAGIAFGGETGFLVGAVSGFVSNMFFGQGSWTPWQMFAFGVIGFLAGVFFRFLIRSSFSARSRVYISIFGFLSTFIIYGGIMNPASVLMYQQNPAKEMFYIAYMQGIPFDLVHAVSTLTFLYAAALPMLEKLDRIKVKYGLVE